MKEKTLVVTKNPQGEGGEKGDFFGCCLTEKRCKVVIVPREEDSKKKKKKKAHTLIYAEWSRHTT